jgi:hypothetical protein
LSLVREARYPAARAAAARLAAHFASLVESEGEAKAPPPPGAREIETLVDAAFWASLEREEGYPPEISLAFLPMERARSPLRFASPLPMVSRALAKLAPAVERPGIHLGVWRAGGELQVWGTTRAIPSRCLVVEVLGPGRLVVKHRTREDSPKFRNVAVFEGEEVKVLAAPGVLAPRVPALLQPLLAPEADDGDGPADVLLRLAVSMRAHGRGGTLLVVPAAGEGFWKSIVRPITYAVEPPFPELRERVADAAASPGPEWSAALARAVEAVAGLTAVDGATLINDRYELLAFGVKILRPDGRPQVERVAVSEPIEGGEALVVAPETLGGTRHSSAAQFAQDQPDALVLVASQDGRFTAFAWSEARHLVHAYRLEALLL